MRSPRKAGCRISPSLVHSVIALKDPSFANSRFRIAGHLVNKKRVDALMLEELRRLAEECGDDAEKIMVEPWTNHDLRRTLRSGLSALRVSADVAEAVLAHVKPGIRGVYDRYDHFDEKRAALEAWEGRVRSLVEPAVAKVLPFTGRP